MLGSWPAESRGETTGEDWARFGRQVEFVHLQLPATDFTYHYRLVATIAFAEISRLVGRRPTVKIPTAPRPPIYDHKLARLAEANCELVGLEELMNY